MDLRPYLQFNRKLSVPLSRRIADTALTPNFISLCGVCCAVLGALAMSRGGRLALLTGALYMHAALILDNCDGEVARLKGLSTSFGRWLDSVCDVAVDILLWAGLYAAAVNTGRAISPWWFWLAAAGSFFNFFLVIWERRSGCSSSIHDESSVRNERRESSFFSVLDTLEHNGDAALLIWVMALLGDPVWFLAAAALYMNLMALTRFITNLRKLLISAPKAYLLAWNALAFGFGLWILSQVLYGISWNELLALIHRAGWPVLLMLIVFPLCTFFHTLAFRALFEPAVRRRIPLGELFWIKLTGEAFNKVTPFVDIGGDPAKALLLKKRGLSDTQDALVALGVFRVSYVISEILLVLAGLAALTWLRPSGPVAACVLTAVGISALYIYLIVGSLKRFAGSEVNRRVKELLRFSNQDLRVSVFWNTVGWVTSFLEVLLALRLFGVPIGAGPAFIVHSLLQAVQTLSFFIPGNVGAQEGGLAFLLAYFYFSPAGGVALSLAKRARQLVWALLAMPLYYYLKGRPAVIITGQGS